MIWSRIVVLPEIDSVLEKADTAVYHSVENETLKDFVMAAEQKRNSQDSGKEA